jgi:hypothetical protein
MPRGRRPGAKRCCGLSRCGVVTCVVAIPLLQLIFVIVLLARIGRDGGAERGWMLQHQRSSFVTSVSHDERRAAALAQRSPPPPRSPPSSPTLLARSKMTDLCRRHRDCLTFTRPATRWAHGTPLGNGRLGAMVHGGVRSEVIGLNEDSIFDGRWANAREATPEEVMPTKDFAGVASLIRRARAALLRGDVNGE